MYCLYSQEKNLYHRDFPWTIKYLRTKGIHYFSVITERQLGRR